MDENLVGYLLGCLDEPGQRQVEAYLHANPDARRKLAYLKRAMSPLAADRDDAAPPLGLAARTLAHIEQTVGSDLPRAPREPAAPAAPRGSWWRCADVLVAAALVMIMLGAASPLFYRWQRLRGTLECQENLRQFFVGLTAYRDRNGDYPDPTRQAPRNVAGIVVPMLAEAGVLPPTFSLRCPDVGPHVGCAFTLAAVRNMPDDEFQIQAPNLAIGYAFALGYRDGAGDYHGPWQLPGSTCPIVADRPPSDGSPGNSPNHGGAGQNVLFLDGHCRFVPQRTIGDPTDDIYLNNEMRVAAGIGAQDIVLANSPNRP